MFFLTRRESDCSATSLKAGKLSQYLPPVCQETERREYIDAKKIFDEYFPATLPQESKKILGQSLSGTKEQLELLSDMLTPAAPLTWKEKTKGCETVMCALEQYVGNKSGPLHLFNIAKKSGYVVKLGPYQVHKKYKDGQWQNLQNEVAIIDYIIQITPDELLHLNKMKDIYSIDPKRPYIKTASAFASHPTFFHWDGYIAFQINAAKLMMSDRSTENILTHELCHHLDRQGVDQKNYGEWASTDHNGRWREISGWRQVLSFKNKLPEVIWKHNGKSKFLREYAEKNPWEDFAVHCGMYAIDSEAVKNVSPEKYQFLYENVFHKKTFSPKKQETPLNDKTWNEYDENWNGDKRCFELMRKCENELPYHLLPATIPPILQFESQDLKLSCFDNSFSSFIFNFFATLPKELQERYCYENVDELIAFYAKNNFTCSSQIFQLGLAVNRFVSYFPQFLDKCVSQNNKTYECFIKNTDFLEKNSKKIPRDILDAQMKRVFSKILEEIAD